jgi:integrase
MASVRKRVLPSGEVRWQVDYKDQAGKRRSRQFERKRDAEAFEIKARSEVSQGTHTPDSGSITIKRAAELRLEHCEGDGLENPARSSSTGSTLESTSSPSSGR